MVFIHIVYFDDNLYPGLSINMILRPFLWDIGKQCGPKSDVAERGIRSGSVLFAHFFYLKLPMQFLTVIYQADQTHL